MTRQKLSDFSGHIEFSCGRVGWLAGGLVGGLRCEAVRGWGQRGVVLLGGVELLPL